MNLLSIGRVFLLGLYLAQNNFVLAQEPAPEPPAQTTAPQAAQESSGQAEKTAVSSETPPVKTQPLMEIKRLDTAGPLYSFELREAGIGDLFRTLAHDYKLNLLVDKEVSGQVTASLSNVSLEEALQTIAESENLKLEKKGNIIWVRLNLITKVFTLKYIEAKKVLEASLSTTQSTQTQAQGSASAQGTATQDSASAQNEISPGLLVGATNSSNKEQLSTVYNLLSDEGKIFLGAQLNSIVVTDYPINVDRVEEYLKTIDQKIVSRVFKLKYMRAAEVVGEAISAKSTSESVSAAAGSSLTAGSSSHSQ